MNQREPDTVIPYAGPTTPRYRRSFRKAMTVAGSLAAGASAVFMMIAAVPTRCRGSTRSAQLMWEARQARVEREIAEATAAVKPPADEEGATPPQ
jgi:hypothetical protein